MFTAAQLRVIARDHMSRALLEIRPVAQAVHLMMAREFERDAEVADREERRAVFRRDAEDGLRRATPALMGLAA